MYPFWRVHCRLGLELRTYNRVSLYVCMYFTIIIISTVVLNSCGIESNMSSERIIRILRLLS